MITKRDAMIRAMYAVILLAVVNAGGLVAAAAQSFPQPTPGLWTIGPAAACPAKSYFWTVTDNNSQFRDQAGNVDNEQIVSKRSNGFTTQTVQSPKVPAGTTWDYRFVSDFSVEVRNLATGKAFVLNRCSATAGTSTSRDSSSAGPSVLSPTGAYSYAEQSQQGKMSVSEVPACDVNAYPGCQGHLALKAKIVTSNAAGSQCDVDAVENVAARVTAGGVVSTVLVADAIRIDVTFTQGRAVVSNNGGGDFGAFCGIGAYFQGNWSKTGALSGTMPAENAAITQSVRAMFGGQTVDEWVFVCPSQSAYASIKSLAPRLIKQTLQNGDICKAVRGRFRLLAGVDRLQVSEITTVYGLQVDYRGHPTLGWLIMNEDRD